MKEKIYNFLKNEGEATFTQIFNNLKKEMNNEWKKTYKNLTSSEIDERKMGEVYQILTVDNLFTKKEEQNWVLTETLTLKELKESKIKILENKD